MGSRSWRRGKPLISTKTPRAAASQKTRSLLARIPVRRGKSCPLGCTNAHTREVAHLKDDLMPRYASLIYNGYWWSPERQALQALIDHTQQHVNGWVRVKLYKGAVSVVARDSQTDSLFDPTIATFEDDAGAYDQKDAAGFIKLNALRMRIAAQARRKRGAGRRKAG